MGGVLRQRAATRVDVRRRALTYVNDVNVRQRATTHVDAVRNCIHDMLITYQSTSSMADDDCDVVLSAGVFCLFYMDEDEQDTNSEQRRRRVRRPRRFWVHNVIQRREVSYSAV